jgi:8-oxo-dGTP pyrophosphatase MutT (NUDIX family)
LQICSGSTSLCLDASIARIMTEQQGRGGRSLQQAAVLAVRQSGAAIEMCLIRRRDAKSWGIPKGFIEPGDTPEETALNEAWEEAGINGQLVGEAIGTYKYAKSGARLTVAVYVMRVVEELTTWPEMRLRDRRWIPMDDAASALKRHPVLALLEHVSARLGL